jgi:hypothetical protein
VTQVQKITCTCCEGYKRVAIITSGPALFGDIYNKPLAVTFAKARKILTEYEGDDAGALTMFVRRLADKLDVTPCPHCNATGIAYTLTFGEPGTSFEETA